MRDDAHAGSSEPLGSAHVVEMEARVDQDCDGHGRDRARLGIHHLGSLRQAAVHQQKPILALQDGDVAPGAAEQGYPLANPLQLRRGLRLRVAVSCEPIRRRHRGNNLEQLTGGDLGHVEHCSPAFDLHAAGWLGEEFRGWLRRNSELRLPYRYELRGGAGSHSAFESLVCSGRSAQDVAGILERDCRQHHFRRNLGRRRERRSGHSLRELDFDGSVRRNARRWHMGGAQGPECVERRLASSKPLWQSLLGDLASPAGASRVGPVRGFV